MTKITRRGLLIGTGALAAAAAIPLPAGGLAAAFDGAAVARDFGGAMAFSVGPVHTRVVVDGVEMPRDQWKQVGNGVVFTNPVVGQEFSVDLRLGGAGDFTLSEVEFYETA